MNAKRLHDLPTHTWKTYRRRKISQIKRIVVHHFAGWITIEGAAELHVSKGWPGIGYWCVINTDGQPYIVNDLDVISYNVANNNTPTVGIALRGDYQVILPERCMLTSLKVMIEALHQVLGPLPVYCHSDFVATECPGGPLRDWVKEKYPSPSPIEVRRWRWDGADHL